MRLSEIYRRTLTVVKAPRVEIAMFGNSDARKMFELFNKPHPRFPFVKNKVLGMSLLKLPATFEEYLKNHKNIRVKRKKSRKAGYEFHRLNAIQYYEDMLAINRSLPVRQGNPMSKEYLDPDLVRSFCEQIGNIYGVLRSDGTLAAYLHVVLCGDVFTGTRLLGHADDLKNEVMYFLMTECIREFIELRNKTGYPNWAAYDTTWGASPGMIQFKTALGFKPYNVRWVWKEEVSRYKAFHFLAISQIDDLVSLLDYIF